MARDREKLQIIQKHLAIDEKMQRMKETKLHLLEYHRIANELRVQGLNNSAIH